MIRRNLLPTLEAALADTPAVYLAGPRQAGKTTLAQQLTHRRRSRPYFTLDDPTVLGAARSDPSGFLEGLAGNVILDEVQRAPELFLPLKASIDRARTPGRFLLTGSADVLVVPQVASALAGRVELLTLWPFSQGEIEGRIETFVDAVFSAGPLPNPGPPISRKDLVEAVVRGGFPEARTRAAPDRREAWFRSYLETLLQRDVRDLAAVEGLTALPHLLALLTARTGGLLNAADLARAAALPQTTVKRYLALLEGVFLVRRLSAWSGGQTARLVKAPKTYAVDSGLAAHLAGADASSLQDRPERFGPLLETFVVAEVIKQVSWSRLRPTVHHYRTHTGQEVDLVLEDRRGRVVGLEVKAASTIGPPDFRGLQALAAVAGDRFVRGVVLHVGQGAVPFGPNLHALPVSALWRGEK